MTVLQFPKMIETKSESLRGIEQCLEQLRVEAARLRLPLVAHMIGAAREAALDTLDELEAESA